MDLILWRHAEAEDGVPDLARKLNKRGLNDAQRIADWLLPQLPAEARILVSPAVRARQTAEALQLPFTVLGALAPDASIADILHAAGWPDDSGAVVVVGHQPTLGRVAAWLLSGIEADWRVKKANVWWLSNRVREKTTQTFLRAVISPDTFNRQR